MGKLTARQVEHLIEPGTYEDGDGLRMVIQEPGRKFGGLRFQPHGKRREMGLGGYPQFDLKKARTAAYEYKGQILEIIAVRPFKRVHPNRAATPSCLDGPHLKI